MAIQPTEPGPKPSSEVWALRAEGDKLALLMAAMRAAMGHEAFKALAPLDAHLFTLQVESMQAYLHVLTIRLARANDAANGILPDTASALAKKPRIIMPSDIN